MAVPVMFAFVCCRWMKCFCCSKAPQFQLGYWGPHRNWSCTHWWPRTLQHELLTKLQHYSQEQPKRSGFRPLLGAPGDCKRAAGSKTTQSKKEGGQDCSSFCIRQWHLFWTVKTPRPDVFDAVYNGNMLFQFITQPAVSRTFDLFQYVYSWYTDASHGARYN